MGVLQHSLNMKRGKYTEIDFRAFAVRRFTPHLFKSMVYGLAGCGATALGLLTGVSPLSIMPHTHWSDDFMLSFLRKRKFTVVELTVRNLTTEHCFRYPIQDHHVLLIRTKVIKNEATWSVLHDEILYHNFEMTPLPKYEFLNHPLLALYILKHPSWMTSKENRHSRLT
jgi:hypothetical protein